VSWPGPRGDDARPLTRTRQRRDRPRQISDETPLKNGSARPAGLVNAPRPGVSGYLSGADRRTFWGTLGASPAASRTPTRYAIKRACELSCSRELLHLYRHHGDAPLSICVRGRRPCVGSGSRSWSAPRQRHSAARSFRRTRPCVQPVSQRCRFWCVSDAADAAVS
jgi:hypothetical protein